MQDGPDPTQAAGGRGPRRRGAERPARPLRRIDPLLPAWPDPGPAVAVSFSGGGFRASLFGMGVVRGLADLGLLGNVRWSSSVSGGSWPNALLALEWDRLDARGFSREAVDDLVLRPFVDRITTTSLSRKMALNLWKVIGPANRSDLLADAFDDWFGGGRTLGDLRNDCRFIFNATNLNTGRRFELDQRRVGDYRVNYIPGDEVRLADALAASAALPGVLSPMRMRRPNDDFRRQLPREDWPLLVDGAAYDNLGIEPIWQRSEDQRAFLGHPLTVVVDAGASFKTGLRARLGLVGSVRRSMAVVQDQVTVLRERWLIERLRRWEAWEKAEPDAYRAYVADPLGERGPRPEPPPFSVRGVTFDIGTSFDKDPGGRIGSEVSFSHQTHVGDGTPELPPWRDDVTDVAAWRTELADIKMSAGRYAPQVSRDLVYRGWWLTRESIRTFHPDALPQPPPGWVEWYS